MDTTKDFQNEEDLKEIDRFVSGLTSEQAVDFYNNGQEALDSMVRRGEISGLQNDENYERLFKAIGARSATSLAATIDSDPENLDAAINQVYNKTGTAGEVFTGLIDTLTAGAPEGVREGLLDSNAFQRLQADFIQRANNEAETRMVRGIVDGAVAEGSEAVRRADYEGFQEVLQQTKGLRNASELQQRILEASLIAVAEESPDLAMSFVDSLSNIEDGKSGITIGNTDLASESSAGIRLDVARKIEEIEKLQEAKNGQALTQFNKSIRNGVAGILQDTPEENWSNPEAIAQEMVLMIDQSSLSEAEKVQAKKTAIDYVGDIAASKQRLTALSQNALDNERKEALVSTRDTSLKIQLGEITRDDYLAEVERLKSLGQREEALVLQNIWKETQGSSRGGASNNPFVMNRIQSDAAKYLQIEALKIAEGDTSVIEYDNQGNEKLSLVKFYEKYPEEARELQNKIYEFQLSVHQKTNLLEAGPDGLVDPAKVVEVYNNETKAFFGNSSANPGDEAESRFRERKEKREEALMADRVEALRIQKENKKSLEDFVSVPNSIFRVDGKQYSNAWRTEVKRLKESRLEVSYVSQGIDPDRPNDFRSLRPNVDATASLLEVGGVALYYKNKKTGVIPAIRDEEDEEERWDLFRDAVDNAPSVFEQDAKALTEGFIAGRTNLVRQGFYGNFVSRISGTWKVDETRRQADLEAYQNASLRVMAPSAQNLRDGLDRFGVDLPDPETIPVDDALLLDIREYDSYEALEADAKEKASLLGVSAEELIEGQNKYYSYQRYVPTNPKATTFTLKAYFE
jgi:hypothetical protein